MTHDTHHTGDSTMTKREIIAELNRIEVKADRIIQAIPFGRGGSPEQEEALDQLHRRYVQLEEDLANLEEA